MEEQLVQNEPVRILLVEDHDLMRQSLAFELNESPDIEILGGVRNGHEAIDAVEGNPPDIILMDIVLPVLNGIKATQQIKQQFPAIKVIMLTSHEDESKIFESFSAGADGYCLKDTPTERLLQVIRLVREGALWLEPSIAQSVLRVMPLLSSTVSESKHVESQVVFDLSTREVEILTLIAEGLSNKDISERLVLSIHTVKNHVKNILQKLSVEDRTQAAILALKNGFI